MLRTYRLIPLRLIPSLSAFMLAFGAAPYAHARDVGAMPAAQSTPLAQADQAGPPDWAFEESDLAVDPGFRFGTLGNGLRYIIRHNTTPEGQGQVRLWINAGSTSEKDDELGYAHFIEHMAFNGSAKVPEGEMVKLLEREGLAFGADTNASTSFDYTLYKLDLPRNDPALLDTALMLMRETASELTFDPAAVEREKGVVLSERRVRNTFAQRSLEDRIGFFYPAAHFVDRLPIGTLETLKNANAELLKGLWQRTYVPGNSAIIVSGDFDPDTVEAAITAHFASWAAAPVPQEPDAGPVDPDLAGETHVYVDPALSERITVARNGPWVDEPDTAENRRIGLLRQIGYGILNRRFQRIARTEKPPFRSAGFGTSAVFEAGLTTNLIIDSGDSEWRKGLIAAATEYRTALAFGFSEAEVAEQLANIRTDLEDSVAAAETRSNNSFTDAAFGLLEDEMVPTTPASGLARFEAYAGEITADAVMDTLLDEAIPLDNPLIRFEGRTKPEGGGEAIRAAWDEAMQAEITRGTDAHMQPFAYTDFGTPGTVVDDTVVPELGIRTLRFTNGLRLNLKSTDLEQDRISARLNVDGGMMLNTAENPLATAMVTTLPQGGLGKHTLDEMQSVLAGRSVNFDIGADEDTFTMSAGTTPRDLELQLQLFAAMLTDPGYRPQGEDQYRRNIANFFARKNATPESALNNALGGIISDDDPRFTLQPEPDYKQLSFDKLARDIGDRLAHGALELALVGDFDEDEAIALVARTLGALPIRDEGFRPYTQARLRGFTSNRTPRVLHHSGKPDQAVLRFSWPTRDDKFQPEHIALELLERVTRLELNDVLREALGKTYSPGVSASQSRSFTGYGTFDLSASVDVADVDATRNAMISTIESLRAAPVDDDTLLRARKPLLEALDNILKTNGGWMQLADRAQGEAFRLDRFKAAKGILAGLSAQDLQDTAVRYLDPQQRLEIVVLPEELTADETAVQPIGEPSAGE